MVDPDATVAIACQGGGSHTAFTAGVLKRLLSDPEYEVAGVSGTSGGAVCAATAWYGLLAADAAPDDLLEAVWADIAATSVADAAVNAWTVWGSRLGNSGLPLPGVSPYHVPFGSVGQERLRETLERHVAFERFDDLAGDGPGLAVGAVDVTAGTFETFTDGEVTAETVLASAAIPTLFEAVEVGGRPYWDGLFSQNPPIRHFLSGDVETKPDELWVVQINPQARGTVPTALADIYDRRNELAGNLSLNQELRVVELVNGWLADGALSGDEYKHVTVRRIGLAEDLDAASKFDRRPSFVRRLMARGEERAAEFVERVAAVET